MACLEVSRNLRKTTDRDKAMALSYLPKFESIQKQIQHFPRQVVCVEMAALPNSPWSSLMLGLPEALHCG